MIFIWANKSNWKKPGPIAYMGLLNAASLAQIGHETHLFLSAEGDVDVRRDLKEYYGIEPHPLLNIHLVCRRSGWSEKLYRNIYRQAIALARAKIAVDRVVFLTREGGLLPTLSRICKRSPNFLTFYESHDLNVDPAYRGKVSFTQWRKKWNERWFLPRISGLICITQAQQKLYRKILPDVESMALPLGCLEFPQTDPERRRKLRRIGYAGHLHGEKGLDVLVRATTRLVEKNIELSIFGGHGLQIDSLKARFGQLAVSGRVKLFPFMGPRDLHRHLADEISMGIVPLVDTFYNRYLTCPVKGLDYLSHWLPTVASDLPSTRELLAESAVYVPPEDADALVAAVVDVLDSPEKFRRMSELARTRAMELAWSVRSSQIASWSEERFAARGDRRRQMARV